MVLTEWGNLLTKTAGFLARPGATAPELARCEERLRTTLPGALKELYLVSDGVYDQRGQYFVVWPLDELVRRNEQQWAEGDAGRRELLAFGDDGTGIPFCVPREGEAYVFSWNPVETRARWLANDLGDFWAGWTSGEITTYLATT